MDWFDAVEEFLNTMTDEQRQAYLDMWRAETRLPPWKRALSIDQDVKLTIH